MTDREAVRNAVVQRIEFLDANFLAALNAYIQVRKYEADLCEVPGEVWGSLWGERGVFLFMCFACPPLPIHDSISETGDPSVNGHTHVHSV